MSAFDVDYPRVVLGGLVVATVVALAVAGSASSTAFGTYNAGWDGASTLRAQAESVGAEPTVVRNETNVTAPANGTVRVILSPDRAYTSEEAAALRRFVESGGTLLVAEDFGGRTNPLLAAVGATARVDGRPLRDEREYDESPAMPVADDVSNHSLAQTDALTLNHGTAVRPNGATVLVRTSPSAYLDADGNGALDETETLASYPVATVERVGDGRVLVLGDPSVFINAMLDRSGNRAFTRGVFAAHERVLLDYSHAERLPPLALALLVLRESVLLQVVVGGVTVALLGLWGERPKLVTTVCERLKRPSADDAVAVSTDELVGELQRRHPDWDDERVRRVVEGVRGETEPSSNEFER